MALDPNKNKPQDPALASLQSSYAPVRQGYDAANAQVRSLTDRRNSLQGVVKPDLVVPRNDFAPVTQVSDTPGGVTALQAVNEQLGQATQARDAYIPKLNAAAQGFRDYTERTNANTLLRQVGAAPLAPARTLAPGAAPPRAAGAVTAPPVTARARGLTPATATGPAAPAQAPQAFTNAAGQRAYAPAGVAVSRDARGNPVFSATGESVARGDASLARSLPPIGSAVGAVGGGTGSASGAVDTSYAAAAAAPARTLAAPAAVATPGVVNPRSLSGDLSGAEKERQALASTIDSQLTRLDLGGMHSRGERELYQSLLAQRGNLTGKRIDQVTGLETQGAQLDAQAAGENAHIAAQIGEGNADRAFRADAANLDAATHAADRAAENDRVYRTLTDRNGNVSAVTADGRARQLTGADGKPFQEQLDPSLVKAQTVTPDAEFKALTDQLTQLQQLGRPKDDTEGKQYDQSVAQINQRLDALRGKPQAGSGDAAPAPTVGTVKNGFRFKGGNPADQNNWEKVS